MKKAKWHTRINEIKARRISIYLNSFMDERSNVLDFGAGNMLIAVELLKLKKINLTCVDVIDYNLTARPIIIYDGNKLPFKNKEFDLTYAVFTLHHCKDIENSISEMLRVTKKRILLVEETYDTWLGALITKTHDYFVNRIESGKIDIPFNFRSDSGWKKLFKKTGLSLKAEVKVKQLPFLNLTAQKLYVLDI